MNLTPENGLKMAQAALDAKGGELPDQLVLLVFLMNEDVVENPESRGDPGTNALAQFFSEKGVPIFGLIFDPDLYAPWLQERLDSEQERQDFCRYLWNRIPLETEFCAGLKFKQKWTAGRWVNLE